MKQVREGRRMFMAVCVLDNSQRRETTGDGGGTEWSCGLCVVAGTVPRGYIVEAYGMACLALM